MRGDISRWRGLARLFHISLPSFRGFFLFCCQLLLVCFFSVLSFVSLLFGLLVVIYCAHGMFPITVGVLFIFGYQHFLRCIKFSGSFFCWKTKMFGTPEKSKRIRTKKRKKNGIRNEDRLAGFRAHQRHCSFYSDLTSSNYLVFMFIMFGACNVYYKFYENI